jgi:Rieske Fe-S protein
LSAEPVTDRRRVLVAWIYGLWSLLGAMLGIPALVYLLFPPSARRREEWVEIGELGRLPVKAPEEVTFRRNRKDGWKVTSEKATAWVTRISEKEVVAFAPQCPHLGCAYHWDEQKQNFLCPCHTSTFGLDGRVLSGPSARGLDRYQVRVEGPKVLLGAVVQTKEGA